MIVHRMYRGDDETLTIAAVNSLTDAQEITFSVRRRLRDDSPLQVQKTMTGGDIVLGDLDTEAEVSIASADTLDLEPGMYAWDLEVTDAYGLMHTEARGQLHLRADVTHPEYS